MRLCRGGDRLCAFETFGDATVDVFLGKSLGRGDEHRHFVAAGGQRRFEALRVRRQDRVAHAALAADPRHHRGVVRHLGHPFRRDEACCLDGRQTGIGQPVDQTDLDLGGHRRLLVLQSVARADFDHGDALRQFHI
jgi:hypothetical protein